MPDKSIIYSKNTGEVPVPLTVRIEWLPDGTIKPLMYWTPDGSCYAVKHIFECVHLAHFKEKDTGIRIKVKAEIKETAEPFADYGYLQHETYLYFADNRFCGKNIIDSRYGHPGKEFITVTLDVFPNCDYELVYFQVKNERYIVEKTTSIEPRGSFAAGGIGIQHKVNVQLVNADNDGVFDHDRNIRRSAALFFEINKWFVSMKNTA